MSTLKEKAEFILNEKNTKILSENIKKDIQIFNVTGSLEEGAKIFNSVEEMHSTSGNIGDYGIVYSNSISGITEDTEFSSCKFLNTIILDEAFEESIMVEFMPVDQSAGWYDCRVELNSDYFSLDAYGESEPIRIQYESQDGITYTRTDGGSENIDFGIMLKFEPRYEDWNNNIGKFMLVESANLEGFYEYKKYTSDYIVNVVTDVRVENNQIVYSTENKDISKLIKANNILTNYLLLDSALLTQEDSTSNIVKAYCVEHNVGSLICPEFVYISNNTPNFVISFYGANFPIYEYTINILTQEVTKQLLNTQYYTDGTADITYSNIDITNLDIWCPMNNNSKVDSSYNRLTYYNNNQITAYVDYVYADTIGWVLCPTQFNSKKEYVWNGLFWGNNGAEEGILSKTTDITVKELLDKQKIYCNLSYVTLNPNITNLSNTFHDIGETVLNIETSRVTDMSKMFQYCPNLLSVPNYNTSNVLNMASMFDYCINLTTVPDFDTSNVTDMSYMFRNCYNLTSVPNFNFSNVTNISYMFTGCKNLNSVTNINVSNINNISHLFSYCYNLRNLPEVLDISNVNDITGLFYECNSLENIPLIDTHNITNFSSLFTKTNIKTLPNINTDNAIHLGYLCPSCCNLVNVPYLNTSKVNNMACAFVNCNNLSDASIQNIINMLLNSNITNSKIMNLRPNNSYSVFYFSNITNTRYQNRWSELTQAGWKY